MNFFKLSIIQLILGFAAVSFLTNSLVIQATTSTDLIKYSSPSDVAVYDPEIHKRFPWFVIGWIYGVAQLGVSLYGLAGSCKDFSQSTSDKIGCVAGAIGTAVTIAGAGWAGWNKYIEIGNALLNASKKRDLARRSALENELVEQFTKLSGLPAEFIGHQPVQRVAQFGNQTIQTVKYLPSVKLTTPHNVSYHFAIDKTGDYKFTSVLGNVVNSSATGKREDFNEENFSSGGIEFSHYYVADQDADNGILSQTNDWQTIYDQTYCQANMDLNNDKDRNYVQYQIYDHNNQGTIAAGTQEP